MEPGSRCGFRADAEPHFSIVVAQSMSFDVARSITLPCSIGVDATHWLPSPPALEVVRFTAPSSLGRVGRGSGRGGVARKTPLLA